MTLIVAGLGLLFMALDNQKDQITFIFECQQGYTSWQMLMVLSGNSCVRMLKEKLDDSSSLAV